MIVIISHLIVFFVFIFFWLYVRYHFNYWKRRGIPHDKPKIFGGNMREWTRTKHYCQIFQDTYETYKGTGPFAGFYFNMDKAVIVLEPSLAEKILLHDFRNFENKGFFHNESNDPLTGNLFLIDGPKWYFLKTLLMPTFGQQSIKYMFCTVSNVGEELRKEVNRRICRTAEDIIDITDLMNRFTIDVVGSCAYGVKCDSLRDPHNEFHLMSRKFFTQRRHTPFVDSLINSFPKLAKFLWMKVIPTDVTYFYINIIRDTILHRVANNIKKPDFIDLLIQLNNQLIEAGREMLSLREVAAQAFLFLIAGFGTSSTTASYVLLELAHNIQIQERLRREIKEVMQRYNNKFTYECMKDMKYLEQVILETLRKYPVSPALFRKCNKRYETSDPFYYIEKNCRVLIPTLSYHHDPLYYPEPQRFDPERFSAANIHNVIKCGYLPFGDGPRNCIGMRFAIMHISIGVVQLVKNFKFEICDPLNFPPKIVITDFNLNPRNAIRLKVIKV